jgi:hypothetical protein
MDIIRRHFDDTLMAGYCIYFVLIQVRFVTLYILKLVAFLLMIGYCTLCQVDITIFYNLRHNNKFHIIYLAIK